MFYIWSPNQVLIHTDKNIELNDDWIIEVEAWSLEESIVLSYSLRSLDFLAEKYLKKSRKIKEKLNDKND